MKQAYALLTPRARWTGGVVVFLTVAKGFADMIGVAAIFPFLKILGDTSFIEENRYLAWSYDAFGFTSHQSYLIAFGILVIAVLVTASSVKALALYAMFRWLAQFANQLSVRMLTTYLRRPYEYLTGRHSAEMCTHAIQETQRLVNSVYRSLADLFSALVSSILIISLLAYAEPLVTLFAVGLLGGAYLLLAIVLRPLIADLSVRTLRSNQRRNEMAWEALGGAKQIKLLNKEASAVDRFAVHSRAFATATSTAQIIRQLPRFALEAIAFGGVIILTLVLVIQHGTGSGLLVEVLPTLGLFLFAGYRLMPMLQTIYGTVTQLRIGHSALDIVAEELGDTEELSAISRRDVEPIGLQEKIELKSVSYRYPGADYDSLKNISFEIGRGQMVGVIGHTGSGKTTLMDMLLGLLSPTSGEVLVDGVPLKGKHIRAWRASVGYVAQDIFLSATTISGNIAFGIPDEQIDHERVKEAARVAQIHEFVESLPDGYETEVGEDGVRLSGGQRQRIGIARALYGGAQVLVFDEATSALDNETEDLVMSEVKRLAEDRTIILVAHRLSTVRECDKIITLTNGAVENIGGVEVIRKRMTTATHGLDDDEPSSAATG